MKKQLTVLTAVSDESHRLYDAFVDVFVGDPTPTELVEAIEQYMEGGILSDFLFSDFLFPYEFETIFEYVEYCLRKGFGKFGQPEGTQFFLTQYER